MNTTIDHPNSAISNVESARPANAARPRVRAFCVICAICGFHLAQSTAHAQVATGTPPFGSFGGGPDIVDNSNLNLHFAIPVVNRRGRGLPFYYILSFASSVWSPKNSSGASTWTHVGNWG